MRNPAKPFWRRIVWTLAVLAGVVGIGSAGFATGTELGVMQKLSAATSWAYQLQEIDLDRLARIEHDVLVIDYSSNGDDEGEFSRSDVVRLQTKPNGGRRIVLAYLSVGEAEDYRFYWQDDWSRHPPSWLDAVNPDWPGNYALQYWDPDWQSLILDEPGGYLHRIMSAGFDGVYLDRVDGYLNWESRVAGADRLMRDFVHRIAAEARQEQSDFLIIQQNAEPLLAEPEYRNLIDAVSKEDLVFGLAGDGIRNQAQAISESIAFLNMMRSDGKSVFAVEYGLSDERLPCARAEIKAQGFVPLFAERSLSRMPPRLGRHDRQRCQGRE